MRAVNHFSKKLDKIFKDGNPTKAQIIDAFHKSVNKCTVCDDNPPEICGDCANDLAQTAKSHAYCSR